MRGRRGKLPYSWSENMSPLCYLWFPLLSLCHIINMTLTQLFGALRVGICPRVLERQTIIAYIRIVACMQCAFEPRGGL